MVLCFGFGFGLSVLFKITLLWFCSVLFSNVCHALTFIINADPLMMKFIILALREIVTIHSFATGSFTEWIECNSRTFFVNINGLSFGTQLITVDRVEVGKCDLGLLLRPEISRNNCSGPIPFSDGGCYSIFLSHPPKVPL